MYWSAQTILPLLNNDFVEIIENCVNGTLKKLKLEWNALRSICIVIASKGYPDSFDKNILIENLEKFENSKDKYIFHAGTKKEDDRFYSTGGRVLNFVSVADNFKKARDECLNQIKELIM